MINFMDTFTYNTSKLLDEYMLMDVKIQYLTGYDLEHLLKLLAAGYTLEPPKNSMELHYDNGFATLATELKPIDTKE